MSFVKINKKDIAKIIGISLPTVNSYTKHGIFVWHEVHRNDGITRLYYKGCVQCKYELILALRNNRVKFNKMVQILKKVCGEKEEILMRILKQKRTIKKTSSYFIGILQNDK